MMELTKDVQIWNRQLETLKDFDDDAIELEKVNHRTDLRNGSFLHPLKLSKLVAPQANKPKVMDFDLVSWIIEEKYNLLEVWYHMVIELLQSQSSNCLLTMALSVYTFSCYAQLWDLHFILPVPQVFGDLEFHFSHLVVQHVTRTFCPVIHWDSFVVGEMGYVWFNWLIHDSQIWFISQVSWLYFGLSLLGDLRCVRLNQTS